MCKALSTLLVAVISILFTIIGKDSLSYHWRDHRARIVMHVLTQQARES